MLYKYSWHSIENESTVVLRFRFDIELSKEIVLNNSITNIPCIHFNSTISNVSIPKSDYIVDLNEDALFSEGVEKFNNGEFELSAKW